MLLLPNAIGANFKICSKYQDKSVITVYINTSKILF